MIKDKENKQEIKRDCRTPHSIVISNLPKVIFSPIVKRQHKHFRFVKNFELVNGQPVSNLVTQESDSLKDFSKYRVGDFSVITLDTIGIQSLRPQSYSPDIDAMLATIK